MINEGGKGKPICQAVSEKYFQSMYPALEV
jgi:hypothetical protein